MKNITVFSNRLDESNGIVENVLEMKAKRTPWYLLFAHKAKSIVSFVQNLLSLLTQKEGVRGGQVSAFFQSAASAVVGIGLLAGSLLLLAEPIGTGRGGNNPPIVNVCAPTVEAIWITEDQASHRFTVKVTLSSVGWEQFGGQSYTLTGRGWQYNNSFVPALWSFSYRGGTTLYSATQRRIHMWSLYRTIWFDLPSASSSDYSFEIEPN